MDGYGKSAMKYSTCLLLQVFLWFSAIVLPTQVLGQLSMRGTDISALPVLEAAGATYSDGGVTGDAVNILNPMV